MKLFCFKNRTEKKAGRDYCSCSGEGLGRSGSGGPPGEARGWAGAAERGGASGGGGGWRGGPAVGGAEQMAAAAPANSGGAARQRGARRGGTRWGNGCAKWLFIGGGGRLGGGGEGFRESCDSGDAPAVAGDLEHLVRRKEMIWYRSGRIWPKKKYLPFFE